MTLEGENENDGLLAVVIPPQGILLLPNAVDDGVLVVALTFGVNIVALEEEIIGDDDVNTTAVDPSTSIALTIVAISLILSSFSFSAPLSPLLLSYWSLLLEGSCPSPPRSLPFLSKPAAEEVFAKFRVDLVIQSSFSSVEIAFPPTPPPIILLFLF